MAPTGASSRRDRLTALAHRRNISVVVEGSVSKHKLLAHLCVAKGHVHYAAQDDNPRAPYEALYAGNPVFASFSSHLAAALYEEAFVFGSDFEAPPHQMNADFAAFMAYVRGAAHADRRRIRRFAKNEMSARAVYGELCRRVGLCTAGSKRPRESAALDSL
eukprot:jgi/Tetstr1/448818/TSEL_003786.t1